MFTASVPQFDYTHPWDIDFETRFAMLVAGSPRAAYIYSRPDTSTFRYRCYNVAQSLATQTGPSASWFTERDMDRMDSVLANCDVLILCRNALYAGWLAKIAAKARALGIPIAFDVDDLVFDASYTHLLMDTLGLNTDDDATLDYWYGYCGRVAATFQLADTAIVTNPFLATRAGAWSKKPVAVLQNALNAEQEAISAKIWNAHDRSGWSRDARFHVGYFSGSPSHTRDFALIEPALGRLMDRREDVWLRIVGFMNDRPELARHRHRIETVPLVDFINLQREIGAVEVNLVPLHDNDFTNCKSELKWFEAAIVGTLTVASPTVSYRDIIEHGTNGWLAGAQGWDAALETVVDGFDDHHGVRVTARAQALARYGHRHQTGRIASALFGLPVTPRSQRAPAMIASPG